MLFSSSKLGHIGQIISTGTFVQIGAYALTMPTACEMETFVRIVVQVAVGVVTIVATIRKMRQKPETVVQAPVAAVVVTPAPAVPAAIGSGVAKTSAASAPASDVAE